MNEITITRPDDWHCHFRDNEFLERTVHDCAAQFARALVMPNLKPPLTTVDAVIAYRERIHKHAPKNFTSLMTLYLTETLSPGIISAAKNIVTACKYYPASMTTNAEAGVRDIKNIYPILEVMQENGIPLCLHGEAIGADIFDREKIFLDTLSQLIKNFPKLRLSLEHISSKSAVDFVLAAPKNIVATITPHHLHYNRNDIFDHGIRPHYFCLPILKREEDQKALINAATSGNPKFFLGTDSAPHEKHKKESACGCAGIYSSHAAMAFYTDIFDQANALDRLENFASHFGADFYQLPRNTDTLTLIKNPWKSAETLSFGETLLVPMKAGETIPWQIQH